MKNIMQIDSIKEIMQNNVFDSLPACDNAHSNYAIDIIERTYKSLSYTWENERDKTDIILKINILDNGKIILKNEEKSYEKTN